MPFQISGKRGKDTRRFAEDAAGALGRRRGTTADRDRLLREALQTPTAHANQFTGFFADAANAAAAPALRDFRDISQTLQANTASRFGGNVSSEENRVLVNANRDFSRGLTEALARVGPQAVAAGQNQTRLLLGARQIAGAEELDLQRLLLQAVQGQKDKGNFWAKLFGAGAGVAVGVASGNPVAGVSAGQAVSGAFG